MFLEGCLENLQGLFFFAHGPLECGWSRFIVRDRIVGSFAAGFINRRSAQLPKLAEIEPFVGRRRA